VGMWHTSGGPGFFPLSGGESSTPPPEGGVWGPWCVRKGVVRIAEQVDYRAFLALGRAPLIPCAGRRSLPAWVWVCLRHTIEGIAD